MSKILVLGAVDEPAFRYLVDHLQQRGVIYRLSD